MKKLILLIALAAVTSMSLSSCSYFESNEEPMEHAQVVVVGAGMAGLTSALSLTQQGISVILLEKENRVGGRIYAPSFAGVNCNMGAQYFFSGIHPLIDPYVEASSTQLATVEGYIWQGNFSRVSQAMLDIFPAPDYLENDFIEAFTQLYEDWLSANVGKAFFFDKEPENSLWNAFEAINSYSYLLQFPSAIYDFLNAEMGAEAGGSLSNLSAIVLVGWAGGPSGAEKILVQHGNQALAEKIKDDIEGAGGKVYFNSEVVKVYPWNEVVCQNGRRFTADYVVVATPADVTKNIVTALPEDKVAALDAVEYAPVIEIAFNLTNFPSAEELPAALFVDEDVSGFLNQTGTILGEPAQGTIISACITKPDMLGLPDDQLIARTTAVLKKVSPQFDPTVDILDYLIVRWQDGIFQWPAGFAAQYQSKLREPVGKIYFAGDYTGDPTLMGAAWSGASAAEAILEAIY